MDGLPFITDYKNFYQQVSKMITKNILEAIVNLMPVASKDETRYHLCGVHIQAIEGGKVRIQATNGHMAAIQTIDGRIPEGKYLMRRDMVKAAKMILDECRHIEEIPCDIDAEKRLIYGLETKARIEKSEEFPDIASVMPKHSLRAAITLDADYILTMARVLRGVTGSRSSGARIVFDPTSPMTPALIEKESVDGIQTVIMPMRDTGTNTIAEDIAGLLIRDDDVISLPKNQGDQEAATI